MERGRRDHAGARRRRPHDHRLPAGQHGDRQLPPGRGRGTELLASPYSGNARRTTPLMGRCGSAGLPFRRITRRPRRGQVKSLLTHRRQIAPPEVGRVARAGARRGDGLGRLNRRDRLARPPLRQKGENRGRDWVVRRRFRGGIAFGTFRHAHGAPYGRSGTTITDAPSATREIRLSAPRPRRSGPSIGYVRTDTYGRRPKPDPGRVRRRLP